MKPTTKSASCFAVCIDNPRLTRFLGATQTYQLAGLRADLVKWMFVFWTGSVLATGGLLLGLLRLLKP